MDTILIILILVSFLLMGYVALYNRFQINIIRINEAKANIDSTLRKRFDLLNKSINIIKSNTDEKKVLENVKKSRSKKLDMFELDTELNIAMEELKSYIEKYPDLKNNEQYMNITFGLAETESEITAFKKYYQDIISEYNKMVRRFPSNIVGLISGYKKEKEFK